MQIDTGMDELHSLSVLPLHGVHLKWAGQSTASANLPLTLELDQATHQSPLEQTPLWQLVDEGERYTSEVRLYKAGNYHLLNIACEGSGSFVLSDSTLTIDWQAHGTGPAHYFQTLGLALFLELNQRICLHANALVHNERANLFIAPSRTGKSSLTTRLQQNYPCQLITDDMAAVHWQNGTPVVFPSWPKVRLWPDAFAELKPAASQVKKVHDRFTKQEVTFAKAPQQVPTQVANLYYLQRTDEPFSGVQITPIAPSAALILLLQNSMLGDAYRALGIEAQRMATVSTLLKQTPMYKVSYGSSLSALDDVAMAVFDHLCD